MNSKQQLGRAGEELAAQFFVKKGLKLLARNLKFRYGEIDILALDKQTLVIVEVKTKSNLNFGQPVEMITRSKVHKLRQLASIAFDYAQSNYKLDYMVNYRIDVVTILWPSTEKPTINYYPNIS